MGWKSIPIPDDHVEAVMKFIVTQLQRARMAEWSTEALAVVWHETDDLNRALFRILVEAGADAGLRADRCGDRLGVSIREVAALVHELNKFATTTKRPNLVTAETIQVPLADGSSAYGTVLHANGEAAALVGANPSLFP